MFSVLLLLPDNGLRRWHRALAERLNRDGFDAGAAPPQAVAVLDMLEGVLFRGNDLLDTEPSGAWLRPPSGAGSMQSRGEYLDFRRLRSPLWERRAYAKAGLAGEACR